MTMVTMMSTTMVGGGDNDVYGTRCDDAFMVTATLAMSAAPSEAMAGGPCSAAEANRASEKPS